jgi:large subunit ribosomal protein L15
MAKKSSSGPRSSRKRGQHKPSAPVKGARRTYTLSNLHPPAGSRKRKVRVGRGIGSKLGKTSGAGNKGQKSRRGYSRRRGFEGGQMPLHRRMPKRGFHSPFGVSYSVVNLEELNVFPAGETVTPELLRAHGFVRRAKDPIKVLGDGELKSKLTIHAHAFSASAKEKITAAGGTFEVVSAA